MASVGGVDPPCFAYVPDNISSPASGPTCRGKCRILDASAELALSRRGDATLARAPSDKAGAATRPRAGYSSVGKAIVCRDCSNQRVPDSIPGGRISDGPDRCAGGGRGALASMLTPARVVQSALLVACSLARLSMLRPCAAQGCVQVTALAATSCLVRAAMELEANFSLLSGWSDGLVSHKLWARASRGISKNGVAPLGIIE